MSGGARRAVAGVIVAMAVALAGCAADTPATEEPPVDEIPVMTGPPGRTLPLDAYMWTDESYWAMLAATTYIASDCVARFGSSYPAAPPPRDEGSARLDEMNARRYGLVDLDAAKVHGYRVPRPEPTVDDQGPFNRAPSFVISENQRFLLEGTGFSGYRDGMPMPLDVNGQPLPDDGCLGEAQRTLAEGAQPNFRLYNEFSAKSYDLSSRDSRVVAAVAAWSECMKGKGYTYAGVFDAVEDWPEALSPEEIAAATADVECKIETNLVGIWYAVESAYQRRFIDENAEAFAAQQRYLDNVTRNAARVLAAAR
jgi:hypothetical protein